MGRKIPGRKHKGVRDPEKQQAESIKDKVNAPPTNPDDQHVPKSLSRIMELKDKVKSGLYSLKRKKKKKQEGGCLVSQRVRDDEKPIPVFKQHEGETDKLFLYRVNKICEHVTKEAKFEDKYGVDIKRNKDTGEVEKVVKRPKDELEVLIKKAKKDEKDKLLKKKKKKKKKAEEGPKLTKSQKWQKKKTEKKLKKKSQNDLDFDGFKDQVKFGETVHAPPTLSAPKKVQKSDNAPRPGRKTLLLTSILNKGASKDKIASPSSMLPIQFKNKLNKTINKGIDKKGKRKDLPNALRRQLDSQQKEIIQAYKTLKKKKYDG